MKTRELITSKIDVSGMSPLEKGIFIHRCIYFVVNCAELETEEILECDEPCAAGKARELLKQWYKM